MAEPTPGPWSTALPFIAVGRVREAITLAHMIVSDSAEQREQVEGIFTKLLKAAKHKLNPGERTRLHWKGGSVVCLMDPRGVMLYCVITASVDYPEKLVYALLQEFMASVSALECALESDSHGLQDALSDKMEELLAKYEDEEAFQQGMCAPAQSNGCGVIESSSSVQDVPELAMHRSRRWKIYLLGAIIVFVGCLLFALWQMNQQPKRI